MKQKKDFWDTYWKRFTANEARYATYARQAEVAFNLLLKSPPFKEELFILDLGCGPGEVSILLFNLLTKLGYRVRMVGVDLSINALQNFRDILKDKTEDIWPALANASHLPFSIESFDVVVSFGYASVASYYEPGIQKEIHRVLKPNGILVSDFRNSTSLYFILLKPHECIKTFLRFLGFGKKTYYFRTFGVKKYFSQFGFELHQTIFTNLFPPVSLHYISKDKLVWIDKMLHRTPIGSLLGRIFITAFIKRTQKKMMN